MDIPTRQRDILRIRLLIFNFIWTPIAVVLMWLALTTPWLFFLFSLSGLASLSGGLILSITLQVHSELGLSSRLPAEIPSRGKIIRWWDLVIIFPLLIIQTFIIRIGIEWLRLFSPLGLWILFNFFAGLVTFILGVLILGLWPLLFTQLYWEHKERKIIVKEGNYWVGKAR